MSTVWDKIDPGLATVYSDYLRLREGSVEAGAAVHHAARVERIGVDVHFTGAVAELEALGFRPKWQESEHRVRGDIALADLEPLASHEGVRRIVFGSKGRPFLDRSVPNIRANLAWSRSGSTFTGSTGAHAFVGVIDTGIDFAHKFFMRSGSPATTRIRRIWDQGLVPTGREASPPAALLSGGPDTYGVEYTDAHINDVLGGVAGAMTVRHRDCVAHGTHVASIAAGNGSPSFTYVGVAPEAELIIVKHLLLETEPVDAGGSLVSASKQFRDAVSYIVNTARALAPPLGRPVAINCSFGSSIGPHDGFTDDEDWLTNTFATSTGAVVVFAAGNDAGERQHARIEFPAAGMVEIPLELYDPRTNRRDHWRCRWKNATQDLYIDVWYPHGATTLSGEVDIPFDGNPYIAGPALGAASAVTGTFGGRRYTMYHYSDDPTLTGGTVVHRNLFRLEVIPYRNRHRVGRYMLKLTASGPLTAHLWCDQSPRHGFRLHPTHPMPADVHVVDEFQIAEPVGAGNVVTVAGYDAERSGEPMASFSSPGPLVSYETGLTQPAKPDLAAPGVQVDAAKSRDIVPFLAGVTVPFDGTSMSAPHVTGTIALMLERHPGLTVPEVMDILLNHGVRPPGVMLPALIGAGRLDAKLTLDNTPP